MLVHVSLALAARPAVTQLLRTALPRDTLATASEDERPQDEQQLTGKEAEEVSVFTRETTAHKQP